MDTFDTIWNRLLLRADALDPAQAQDLVKDSFNQLCERRNWSWMIKASSFTPTNVYSTGTVTTVQGSPTVTGTNTAWTGAFIGQQFRVGLYTPIYTITQVLSATQIVLDRSWEPVAANGVTYMVYKCYFTTPADFREFLTAKDPTNNYKLHTNVQQPLLDYYDPQRSQTQVVTCFSFLDYAAQQQGVIGPVLQVLGAGAVPVSASDGSGYTYPIAATFVITITAGGVPGDGTLAFTWFRIANSSTAAVGPLLVTDNDFVGMSDGVGVYFPQVTYVTGDIFTIACVQNSTQSAPRYELWPHPQSTTYNYPFLYVIQIPDFGVDSPALPPMWSRRGDVLLEMALGKAAEIPGTVDAPNPYYSPVAAARHAAKAETLIYELEKKDDETAIRDLNNMMIPFAPVPWMDGSYLASHAWPGYPF